MLQKTVMENWKNSVEVKTACSEDVNMFCSEVTPGHGAVHECLLAHMNHVHGETGANVISATCAKEEFELLREKMEDIDLDENLVGKCARELAKYCNAGQRDGDGGGMQCLEEQLSVGVDFSSACEEKVEEYVRLRNRDSRLDAKLMRACEADISKQCPNAPDSKSAEGIFEHKILDCLIENREKLNSPRCSSLVSTKMEQQAKDWQAAPDIADKCAEDKKKFCSTIQSRGDSKVHDCLFENIKKLSQGCADAEFKEQVVKSEDIKFNPKLFRGCVMDVTRWCLAVENSDKIACLQEHIEDETMTTTCSEKLRLENKKQGMSISFNPKLYKACFATLQKFASSNKDDCKQSTLNHKDFKSLFTNQKLHGSSLACLTTNSDDIEDAKCRAQVFQKEVVDNANVDNRAELKEACSEDLMGLCPGVKKGKSRAIKCLQDHLSELSPVCKKRMEKVKANEDKDIMLKPQAKRKCRNEMKTFCEDVEHGNQVMYACLKAHVKKPGFSADCKAELSTVNIKSTLEATATVAELAGYKMPSGLVISGPLALAAIFALALCVLFAAYCCWKRRAQSPSNYKVVLPQGMSMVEKGEDDESAHML